MDKDKALKLALEAHQAMREWIDAVPDDTVLPAMPGCDRDWLDTVEANLKKARALDKMADNARDLGLDYEPCCKDQTCPKCKPAPVQPVACVQDLDEVKRKHLVYEKGMDWKDPLYTTPPAAQRQWVDPNEKSQKQFLPHIGEPVLFCHDGVTYFGKHTGGSFTTGQGITTRNFNTWECHWMYPPSAKLKEKNA
jgi:hypothetical protein